MTPPARAPITGNRRTLLLGLGAAGLAGCATTAPAPTPPLTPPPTPAIPPRRFIVPPLARLKMSPDRITRITVCLRPFRAAGPRLEVETVAGKRVVHNYGHGGSGWSLSWGSARIAAEKALAGGAKEVAVIGCGAIGLTTAVTLQRAGAKVTIYAADRTPYTRSVRATGTWSPESRIADAAGVDAAFPALWDRMTRTSYGVWQTLLGLPGDPVSWSDRYALFDGPRQPRRQGPPPPGEIDFWRPDPYPDGIDPDWIDVAPQDSPFRVARTRMGTSMQFNVAALAHHLTSDFLLEGGQIVAMTFDTPADLARLKQPVVVNCTGYGARALWKDETVTPVRGQITWLAPQPEVRYGLSYRHVTVLPRPDGIVVQYTGESEMWGYGRTDEVPDTAEAAQAIAAIAPLFAEG